MFNSLLVELGYFDKITVGFLIIGHTHASIDQYFSCLRSLIRSASFIASPLALQHLFSLETLYDAKTRKKYRPPIKQIQLHYVHDYDSFFAPYRNDDINGYGVPYQFQFFKVLGKAVCQYRQFSDESLPWLPLEPVQASSRRNLLTEMYKENVTMIKDQLSLASETGKTAFIKHLGLSDATALDDLVENKGNIREKAKRLQEALPILTEDICIKGSLEQEKRRVDEENGINDVLRYDVVGAQLTLQQNSTKVRGQ